MKHLAAILCIVVGIALSLYGLAAIIGLESSAFGKFSTAAGDTFDGSTTKSADPDIYRLHVVAVDGERLLDLPTPAPLRGSG